MSGLEGRRILLIEDEPLIAMLLEELLRKLGAIVVGPARTLDEAVYSAAHVELDAAIVDLSLHGERSDPAAQILAARGVPFVIVTAYETAASSAPKPFAVLAKPCAPELLEATLKQAIGSGLAEA